MRPVCAATDRAPSSQRSTADTALTVTLGKVTVVGIVAGVATAEPLTVTAGVVKLLAITAGVVAAAP